MAFAAGLLAGMKSFNGRDGTKMSTSSLSLWAILRAIAVPPPRVQRGVCRPRSTGSSWPKTWSSAGSALSMSSCQDVGLSRFSRGELLEIYPVGMEARQRALRDPREGGEGRGSAGHDGGDFGWIGLLEECDDGVLGVVGGIVALQRGHEILGVDLPRRRYGDVVRGEADGGRQDRDSAVPAPLSAVAGVRRIRHRAAGRTALRRRCPGRVRPERARTRSRAGRQPSRQPAARASMRRPRGCRRSRRCRPARA